MKVRIATILLAFVCLLIGKEDVAATQTRRRWSSKENIATAIFCEDTLTDITKLRRIFVASPGFGSFDESYPTGQKCTLVVTGDSTCPVSTVCPNFDLRPSLCDEEHLSIASGKDSKEDGRASIKRCGDSVSSDSFQADKDSSGVQPNALRFELNTASNSEFDRIYKGVRCLVSCVGNEDKGSEETTESTCERCDCEASNRTNKCPTTTCPPITTTCPSIECTTPTPTICQNSTCQPCESCNLTTTACPTVPCPSPPPATTCPSDCPTTQGTTCPASPCERCDCPTTTTLAPKCEVSTCPPPPPATKCPEEVCEKHEPTTCSAPPTLAPCPDPPCPACPTCPPPPACPPLPTPPRTPICGSKIYTIVNAVDNAKLDSRFNRDKFHVYGSYDTFGVDLDTWFTTPQGGGGIRITSTNRPSSNPRYYALRVDAQTNRPGSTNNVLGLGKEQDAAKGEFTWKLFPAPYRGVQEYVVIKSAYNGNCISYNGYGSSAKLVGENKNDYRQWWKFVPEGDFVGCTKRCKIANLKGSDMLDVYNKIYKRVTTFSYHGKGHQISWDIVHEKYGYRITLADTAGAWSLSRDPEYLQQYSGDIHQNWHFVNVRGPGARDFFLIRNAGTGQYLRNMEGQPTERIPVRLINEADLNMGDLTFYWVSVPMIWQ